MIINGRTIGSGEEPYICADLSASHNGSIERGKKLIEIAKECGADSVKFQAYLPETVSLDADRPEFIIKEGPWAGRRLYDLYREAHTPRSFLMEFFEHARKVGITAFSTACSEEDVDFLEALGNPCLKIASLDIVNLPLIEYAASKGKPLIISTGMASDRENYDAWMAAGGTNLFLHCVSAYPCKLECADMGGLRDSTELFGIGIWGYSDHTIGHEAAVMATACGAVMIEKHITLSRNDGGPDDHFATEPHEFAAMVKAVKSAHQAMMGPSVKSGEEAHHPLRPSLYAIADIRKGEQFTKANVRAIRPSNGLPPKDLPELLRLKAKRDIARGTPLSAEILA